MTGRSKRLFGLVATAGLIVSACTGGGANSQVPSVSGAPASSTPASVPPSVAASPSAVADAVPYFKSKIGRAHV